MVANPATCAFDRPKSAWVSMGRPIEHASRAGAVSGLAQQRRSRWRSAATAKCGLSTLDDKFPGPDSIIGKEVPLALGGLVISWNNLEVVARQLMGLLVAPADEFRLQVALTHNMRPEGMIKTFSDLAGIVLDGELKELVQHFATGFDRLRQHRNYLVHGVVGIRHTDGGPRRTRAMFQQFRPLKGGLGYRYLSEEADDINAITAECTAYRIFGGHIIRALRQQAKDEDFAWPAPPPLPRVWRDPGYTVQRDERAKPK